MELVLASEGVDKMGLLSTIRMLRLARVGREQGACTGCLPQRTQLALVFLNGHGPQDQWGTSAGGQSYKAVETKRARLRPY